MKKTALPIILVFVLLSLAGCGKKQLPSPIPPPAPPQPAELSRQAQDLLARAETEFRQARYHEADRLFTEFLRRYADQPGQDLAWLRHAQIQLWSGFPDGARQSLQYVLEAEPPSSYKSQAHMIMAGVELAGNRPMAALAHLADCRVKELKPWERTDYYHLTSQARFALNQPKAALVALVRAYGNADNSAKPSLEQRLSSFASAWPLQTLEELSRLYNSRFPTYWIYLGLAEKAAAVNDWAKVRHYKAEVARRFTGKEEETGDIQPQPPMAGGQGEVVFIPPKADTETSETGEKTELSKGYAQRNYTIGCLLPLSGPLADYGQKLLKGIQLALDSFHQSSSFTLLIEDTANDPETAARGLANLAANPEVFAVIGPLSGSLAVTLADRAAQLEVPLITLTQRSDVSGRSKWVFRDFLTPSDLIEALAQRAVEKLKLTRVAVLQPQSKYGLRMADMLTEALGRHGGQVVKKVSYPPGSYDLSEQMTALGGHGPNQPPREGPLPYDALFIAEDADAVIQVAPQLSFYDLSGFILLGTNLWHEQRLIDQAGPYVQDAVIPSVFFPDSEEPQVKDFVEKYRETYAEAPDLFAALGFDASRIVAEALWGGNVRTRAEFTQVFAKITDYPGVTGLTRMNEKGEAVKVPFLLTVRGDRFVPAPLEPIVPGEAVRSY